MKRFIIFIVIFSFLCGCSRTNKLALESSQQYIDELRSNTYEPCLRSDGQKFKVEILSVDPHISTALFYYFFNELQNNGWITMDEELPFTPDDVYTEDMAEYFSQHCTDGFIDITNYYDMSSEDPADYKKSIESHIDENSIDMLICIGTDAGIIGKSLSSGRIPVLVTSSVSPVASGITNDSDTSGIHNLWAIILSSSYVNQFILYKKTFDFKNLGMIYFDEVFSGMSDYSDIASKTDTKISSIKMNEDGLLTKNAENYYSEYKKNILTLVNEYNIDAFMINSSMVTDENKAEEICNMLHNMGIPVFGQIGDEFDRKGSPLMSVTFSVEDDAGYLVNAMAAVMNGKKPEEIPQEYDYALHVSINKRAADKLGIEISDNMLEYADRIYY